MNYFIEDNIHNTHNHVLYREMFTLINSISTLLPPIVRGQIQDGANFAFLL